MSKQFLYAESNSCAQSRAKDFWGEGKLIQGAPIPSIEYTISWNSKYLILNSMMDYFSRKNVPKKKNK